jgi:hypothetical protein
MSDLDRLAMYEAAVQQVYTLCQHDGIVINGSPEVRAATALVRARIFWYAHVHEGLTTGLRGGRLLMFVAFLPLSSLSQAIRASCSFRNVIYSTGIRTTSKSSSDSFPTKSRVRTRCESNERTSPTPTPSGLPPHRCASPMLVVSCIPPSLAPRHVPRAKIDGQKLDTAWEALQASGRSLKT